MFSITARMDTKNRSLNEDTKSRLSKNSPSEEPQKGVKKKFVWPPPKIFDNNQNNSIKSEEKAGKDNLHFEIKGEDNLNIEGVISSNEGSTFVDVKHFLSKENDFCAKIERIDENQWF